ncbi:cytochrome P450 [Actinoallomurus purpureus]|uniref:cytochrome P450 n=1 Tax=Actinoallomurus purpureus TaxID=478114 RepID=UPI002091F477|nr:cytochrome P450 [Actinoallomurus purpureus]MCO6010131.1 cytochrome P450 [Actinoallomurus purpureus]
MTSDSSAPVITSPPGPGCPAHGGRTPLYGPEFAARPARVYASLRGYGPVAPVELAPGVPASLVISYDAALQVLRDPDTFPKDARRWERTVSPDSPVVPFLKYRPACDKTDGAEHARLRAAVSDGLSRIDLNTLRESVERHSEALIRRFAAKGAADLRTEYALVLPLLVFNEILGCPPEIGDRIAVAMQGLVDNVDTAKNNQILLEATGELVALKRARPAEDLTSWLLSHPARLTDEELTEQLIPLIGLATEPEQNLIANGLRLLLSDDRFAGDLSGGSLPVEDALDEALWTDPPIANWAISYPVKDVEFRGVRLPADQPVVIGFAAANTDPATVSANRTGNRAHLAWGAGPHTCPVQGQARLIASVAMEKLLDALPDMELAVPADRLEWRPGFAQRALSSLPVRFPPVQVPPRPARSAGGATMRPPAGVPAPREAAHPGFLARWWHGE